MVSQLAGHRAAHVEMVDSENSNVTDPTFRSKGTTDSQSEGRECQALC